MHEEFRLSALQAGSAHNLATALPQAVAAVLVSFPAPLHSLYHAG